MHVDRCCYTSQTLWVSTGATPPLTCRIVCRKLICHQQSNESLMKFVFKDRLHFPPPPFWDASPPLGCKEEFSVDGKVWCSHIWTHVGLGVWSLYACVCVIRHHLLAYILTQSYLWGIWSVTGEHRQTWGWECCSRAPLLVETERKKNNSPVCRRTDCFHRISAATHTFCFW